LIFFSFLFVFLNFLFGQDFEMVVIVFIFRVLIFSVISQLIRKVLCNHTITYFRLLAFIFRIKGRIFLFVFIQVSWVNYQFWIFSLWKWKIILDGLVWNCFRNIWRHIFSKRDLRVQIIWIDFCVNEFVLLLFKYLGIIKNFGHSVENLVFFEDFVFDIEHCICKLSIKVLLQFACSTMNNLHNLSCLLLLLLVLLLYTFQFRNFLFLIFHLGILLFNHLQSFLWELFKHFIKVSNLILYCWASLIV